MPPLVNLIYASSAIKIMTEPELFDVLTKSHENNSRLGITGMLLYRGGNFLQVLEGDKELVDNLFKRIVTDPRHHQVILLLERAVAQREFENWSMGFANLDHIDVSSIAGYTPYLTERFDSDRFKEVGFAYTFLHMFKEQMR